MWWSIKIIHWLLTFGYVILKLAVQAISNWLEILSYNDVSLWRPLFQIPLWYKEFVALKCKFPFGLSVVLSVKKVHDMNLCSFE